MKIFPIEPLVWLLDISGFDYKRL